jgi:hypothetical protein
MTIHRTTMISMSLMQWLMKPVSGMNLQPIAARVHLRADRVAVGDVHAIATAVAGAAAGLTVEIVMIGNR